MKQQARYLFGQRMLPSRARWAAVPAAGRSVRRAAAGAAAARTGKILLSWRLIHFPLHIIDYVIAHEIAHLKEINHGPRFWATVERLLPGHQQARTSSPLLPTGSCRPEPGTR